MAKRASEMSVAELMMSRKSSLTSISAADAARASRAPPPPTPRAISREFLKEVREKLREQIGAALFSGGEDGVQVEVEARVGLYVLDGARIGKYAPGNVGVRMGSDHGGGSFESGVTARDFAHLKELLKEQKTNPYEVTKTSREIYVYSSETSGKSRVCVENGKISREVKTPCMQAGVHVASCPFDLRVSASYEHKDRNSALHAIPEGWDMKRSMKRTTYYRKDQLWRFDLAEVSAVKAIDPQTVILTYEVELEMDAAKFLSWMADNQTEDIAAAHNAALELWQHLNLIIALEEGSTTNLVPLEGDAQIAVQAATVAPAGNKWPKTKFPGSMPVGCGRPHVTHVQKHDYYVSEKTDGVRHWLVTAQVATAASEGGGKVVTGLVDRTLIARTMAPFVLPQQQHQQQQQQPQQVNMMNPLQLASDVFGAGTVIDGEVVRNHVNGRDIFMAFDLISAGDHLQHGLGEWEVEGRMIHTLPFHKRYTILRQLVERYQREMEAKGAEKGLYLTVHIKKWHNSRDVERIFKQVSKIADGRMFAHSEYVRCKTDGVVLVHDMGYVFGTDTNLFKWKWADTLSIDFLVHLTQNDSLQFKFGIDPDLIEFTNQMKLDRQDELRLRADLSQQGRVVGEFVFHPEHGTWQYKFPRFDKTHANAVNTVFDTLLEIAACVSEVELKYRLVFADRDDWLQQNMPWMDNLFVARFKQEKKRAP